MKSDMRKIMESMLSENVSDLNYFYAEKARLEKALEKINFQIKRHENEPDHISGQDWQIQR